MRLVHTSDWHLGRRLCEQSLLEDQAHALEQVFLACREERADALLVAGDVYDRALPPEDAVDLLSDFLTRVARDLSIPVIAISGNHDSAGRLGFGAQILAGGRVHLRTSFARRAEPIVLRGADRETVAVYCLPYLEPDVARTELDDPTLSTHDAAVRAALAAARADRAASGVEHAILVAHLFAQGGRESTESERPLVVGGAAQVAADALDGWTYVALGHLHAPQPVAGRHDVRYSGSLLKYSFGEADHVKSLCVVETGRGGAPTVREVPIRPRRDLARISGTFEELRTSARFEAAVDSYVEATYTDRGYVIDVAARLRERFPHLLLAVPAALAGDAEGRDGGGLAALPATADAREQLQAFWAHVRAEEDGAGALEGAHLAAFERALRRAEKGGGPEAEAGAP